MAKSKARTSKRRSAIRQRKRGDTARGHDNIVNVLIANVEVSSLIEQAQIERRLGAKLQGLDALVNRRVKRLEHNADLGNEALVSPRALDKHDQRSAELTELLLALFEPLLGARLVAVEETAVEDLLDGLNENQEIVGREDLSEDSVDEVLADVDLRMK